MCLIAFATAISREYPLVLIANRDEFFDRPTRPIHAWPGSPTIYAGRDEEAGGTWLGINQYGRWAALTNFRQPGEPQGAQSRGNLVTRCLTSSDPIPDIMDLIARDKNNYSGFNLVAGDALPGQAWYYSNRGQAVESLSNEFYALSNGLMQDNWPKMEKLRCGLASLFQQSQLSHDHLQALLSDAETFEQAVLPSTGINMSVEQQLSSPFVSPFHIGGRQYGTRSSCILLVNQQGRVSLLEKQHLPNDTSVRKLNFDIQLNEQTNNQPNTQTDE